MPPKKSTRAAPEPTRGVKKLTDLHKKHQAIASVAGTSKAFERPVGYTNETFAQAKASLERFLLDSILGARTGNFVPNEKNIMAARKFITTHVTNQITATQLEAIQAVVNQAPSTDGSSAQPNTNSITSSQLSELDQFSNITAAARTNLIRILARLNEIRVEATTHELSLEQAEQVSSTSTTISSNTISAPISIAMPTTSGLDVSQLEVPPPPPHSPPPIGRNSLESSATLLSTSPSATLANTTNSSDPSATGAAFSSTLTTDPSATSRIDNRLVTPTITPFAFSPIIPFVIPTITPIASCISHEPATLVTMTTSTTASSASMPDTSNAASPSSSTGTTQTTSSSVPVTTATIRPAPIYTISDPVAYGSNATQATSSSSLVPATPITDKLLEAGEYGGTRNSRFTVTQDDQIIVTYVGDEPMNPVTAESIRAELNRSDWEHTIARLAAEQLTVPSDVGLQRLLTAISSSQTASSASTQPSATATSTSSNANAGADTQPAQSSQGSVSLRMISRQPIAAATMPTAQAATPADLPSTSIGTVPTKKSFAWDNYPTQTGYTSVVSTYSFHQPAPTLSEKEKTMTLIKLCVYKAALAIIGSRNDSDYPLNTYDQPSESNVNFQERSGGFVNDVPLCSAGSMSHHGSGAKKRAQDLWIAVNQVRNNPYFAWKKIDECYKTRDGNWAYNFDDLYADKSFNPTLAHFLIVNFVPKTQAERDRSRFTKVHLENAVRTGNKDTCLAFMDGFVGAQKLATDKFMNDNPELLSQKTEKKSWWSFT